MTFGATRYIATDSDNKAVKPGTAVDQGKIFQLSPCPVAPDLTVVG
nr:hypothetical protein [Sodalis-like endosymbiont of Proechinophthirus fluctus]